MTEIDINKLNGRYLRGIMEKTMTIEEWYDETTCVFLFLSKGEVVYFKKNDVDGYRDSVWELHDEDIKIPHRDNEYKAIGEYIKKVKKCTYQDDWRENLKYRIKTKTKIIDFTTHGVDDYYPFSIWEVI